MSYELRHFIVFVEQDRSFGRPLPDENIPVAFSLALEEHFAERVEQGVNPPVIGDDAQTPPGRGGDPEPR